MDDATLESKLTDLADQIVTQASAEGVTLSDKMAALKIAGSYDLMRRKLKKGDADDGDAENFGSFATTIANAGKVVTQ